MPLTQSFRKTIKARVERDPAFRAALLQDALQALLDGDLPTGKAVLRDYVNATVGFETLAAETGTPAKSLMRMLGPAGNPRAKNLFALIRALQRETAVQLQVSGVSTS